MSPTIRRSSCCGFTLVELLVVITIVAVLASFAVFAARRGLHRADASKALSNLRQSGIILLADAQEKGGRFRYSTDSSENSAGWDLLPYNIVRNNLGLNISPAGSPPEICEIMHWDSRKLKPAVCQMNCLGVNFTDVSDFGVLWIDETIPDPVDHAVKTLILSSVTRSEAYPLLMDSSNSRGEEIFTIEEGGGYFVGLRNSGKANAFFLDGSAGELGSGELKKSGFTKAYDNSTTPPKPRNL